MAKKDIRVAIVGGGIGGLTAAVSLLQAGFDVQVYEQSRLLSEVGAGINISPNAARILIQLGLGEECARLAYRSPFFHQRRWDDGRTLTKTRLAGDIEREFGAPHYIFHRGELHSMLARPVPPERVHLAHRCTAIEQDGGIVRAKFENGAEIEADVLIGADGIFSAVRRTLRGPERPRFACRAYRGLIPLERVRDIPPESTAFLGPGRHFIHYFVSAVGLLNFVGHVEQDEWISENWTRPGRVEDLRAAYAGWHPQVQQAIDDAAAITACLIKSSDDIEGALKLYETVRLPRTTQIQNGSWANLARFHMPDGPDQAERDALMAQSKTDWAYKAIAWVYGHDASDLNAPKMGPPSGH